MKICGLQKTTLLDYPGHVAATVFLGGCSFRCPFCHNSGMLLNGTPSAFTQEEVLSFLGKRRGVLDGVCVTGGEPTLHPDLEGFLQQVRELGLKVKLDTNGYQPEALGRLLRLGAVDYVAMDIKAGPDGYARSAGLLGLDLGRVRESVSILMDGGTPYEFRTTAVKGLHTEADFVGIGQWICGCSAYFLQGYVDSRQVLEPGWEAFSREEMEGFLETVKKMVPRAKLRGM